MNAFFSHAAWAAQELATASLGDARLRKRLVRIVADKVANPTASIPQASGTWAATKATYRFLVADQMTPDAIRAAHRDATLGRVQAHQTILVLQDSPELNHTRPTHTTDLGYLANARSQGLKVHSGLAATLDGRPLGLLYQTVWARDAATKGQKRRTRPQIERESQRWLTTLAAVRQRLPARACVHCTATPPLQPPSLYQPVRMVARLGSFLARRGDGEPDVQTAWRGLMRLDDIAATWLLARALNSQQTGIALMGNG
jgi:hypothetical protein